MGFMRLIALARQVRRGLAVLQRLTIGAPAEPSSPTTAEAFHREVEALMRTLGPRLVRQSVKYSPPAVAGILFIHAHSFFCQCVRDTQMTREQVHKMVLRMAACEFEGVSFLDDTTECAREGPAKE